MTAALDWTDLGGGIKRATYREGYLLRGVNGRLLAYVARSRERAVCVYDVPKDASNAEAMFAIDSYLEKNP